jgi:hypothetical protein
MLEVQEGDWHDPAARVGACDCSTVCGARGVVREGAGYRGPCGNYLQNFELRCTKVQIAKL